MFTSAHQVLFHRQARSSWSNVVFYCKYATINFLLEGLPSNIRYYVYVRVCSIDVYCPLVDSSSLLQSLAPG